jgi:hypothetical protein
MLLVASPLSIGDIFQKKGTIHRIMPFSFSDFGELPHYNQIAD